MSTAVDCKTTARSSKRRGAARRLDRCPIRVIMVCSFFDPMQGLYMMTIAETSSYTGDITIPSFYYSTVCRV
jgi:hypothetical protein